MVDAWQRGEDQRDQKPVPADSDLENSVEPEWLRYSFSAAAEVITPERESAHERGENGADGKGCCAEDKDKLADPDDLIDQPADSGSEEAKQDNARSVSTPGNTCCI